MRAVVAGVIAAIEAVAVALATLLVVTGVAFLVWWLSFGLAAEPVEVVGIAGAVWLLAHLVPLTVELGPEAMQAFGFAPEALEFTLSLAPLGITLVTVAFAARSGWRFGLRGGSGVAGVIGGMVAFGAAAAVIDSFVSIAALPLAGTAAIPAAVYGAVSAFAFVMRSAMQQHPWWLRVIETLEAWLGKLGVLQSRVIVARIGDALRLAAMLTLAYVGLSGLAVGAAFVIGYADITAASQSLQLGIWGTIMMFVAQLVLLPNVVAWSGAWLTGAGFAVGSGTSASPFGALVGPMPGLPTLAAIPEGWGVFAVAAPLIVALSGVVVGVMAGTSSRNRSVVAMIATVVFASAIAGLAIALVSWASSGSAGPGRLVEVGPDPWLTGGLGAAELCVGALLGALAARADLVSKAAVVTTSVLPRRADDEYLGAVAEPGGSALRAYEDVRSSASTEVDEQATVPLEFEDPISVDVPVIPRAVGADLEGVESASADLDEGVTDVIPDEELPVPAAPREPELFDQQETAEISEDELAEAARTAPTAAGTSETDGDAVEIDAAEIDAEALIQAYSWDGATEPEPDEKRTGWRWPRK